MPNVHLEVLTERYVHNENFLVVNHDIAAINRLLAELTKDPKDPHKKLPFIRDRLELLEIVKQGNLRLVVARDLEKNRYDELSLVGMATIHWHKLPTKVNAYIDDVVVLADDKYRGKGIGKKLTLELIKIAKEACANCIDLTSNPTRTEANGLYQKLGFEKKDTNYYRLKL